MTITADTPVAPRVEPLGRRFITPLLVGSALNPLNTSLLATALVPIGQAFGVTGGDTAVLIAALYLASAVAQPTMGRIAESFGPRRVFVVGAALVLVAGALGALATDLRLLLVSRVLLGIGTAAAYPTAILLIRRNAGDRPAGPALGWLSIVANVTVVMGLPLGGLLVGVFGWRATFLINVPLALLAIVTALIWLPRDPRLSRSEVRGALAGLDAIGMVLFGGALSALMVFLMSILDPNWYVGALTLVLAVALVLWERRATGPFFDVRSLITDNALTRTYVRTGATLFVSYCVMYGVTQWLQEPRGLSATTTGLLLLPMTAIAALVSRPVAKRNLVRSPLVLAAGLALLVAGGLSFMTLSTPIVLIVLLTALLGVALGIAGIGNQAALYAQARADQVGTAAGLQRTATYLGAIISSAVISIVYANGVTGGSVQTIGYILLVVTAVTFVMVLADRSLPKRIAAGGDRS
ncbi:MFS transporter [Pseudonocardia halophobica]|uniref:MFS transporter n=1 Tax=Pseudonocardia halophobica TaxID=29401 RepID=UPI003D8BE823